VCVLMCRYYVLVESMSITYVFFPSDLLPLHIFVILACRTLFYCQSLQVNAQKQKGQGAIASDNAVKFLKVS